MTLGQELKKKRSEVGKSLEQISAMTRIHIKILTAIEEDRYSDLPAKAFTRGFIVNYAKALKLDSTKLLHDYESYLEQKFSERITRDQGHQGYAFEGKELEQNKRWMGIGLGVAGVFALAVVFVFKPSNHKRKEKHKDFVTESAEAPVKDTETPEPALAPDPSLTANSSLTSNLASAPNSSATTKARSTHQPAPVLSATPTPATSATPAPSASATPTPAASVTPAPVASATPTPAASATPAPAEAGAVNSKDKLNKGDDIPSSEITLKITLTAQDDGFVRYQSDNRPTGSLILRQGKSLVLKARSRILFESNPAARFQYRTRKSGTQELGLTKFEITKDGELKPYTGVELGAKSPSDSIPPPRAQ